MENASPLVITISRQLGAGGSYIGRQLAKRLDIFYADREIIDQAAKRFSLQEKDLESLDEKRLSFWQSITRACALAPDTYVKTQILPPSDHELFKMEKEIITRIAEERSSVIIGRCGSYILRDHPNQIGLFLHADPAFRKERIQRFYNVAPDIAGKMITQSDKERELYHHTLTGQEWADASRYDLSLATSKIGLENCVLFILKYLELRTLMNDKKALAERRLL